MPQESVDRTEEVPEADHLEQQAQLEPQSLTGAETVPAVQDAPDAVEEADRLEQHATVPGDPEEDYPHGAGEPGWS